MLVCYKCNEPVFNNSIYCKEHYNSDINEIVSAAGVKHDKGKLNPSLVSVYGLLQLIKVYTIGKYKYGDHNWRNGIVFSRIIDAQLRHALLYLAGETHDRVDGQHHQSSVAWAAFDLMEQEVTHPELDDRWKTPPELLKAIHALIDEVFPTNHD